MLYERSKEFAEEFPGVAERLGGLSREEQMDPGIASLLEGAPSWRRACSSSSRASFPSSPRRCSTSCCRTIWRRSRPAVLVQATPPIEDPGLVEGTAFRARRLHRRGLCRAGAARLLPLPAAPRPRAVAAAPRDGRVLSPRRRRCRRSASKWRRTSCPDCGSASGGCRRRRGAEKPDGAEGPEPPVKEVKVDTPADPHPRRRSAMRVAVYEQLFANCRRITIRYLDALRRPAVHRGAAARCCEQIGFGEDETPLRA